MWLDYWANGTSKTAIWTVRQQDEDYSARPQNQAACLLDAVPNLASNTKLLATCKPLPDVTGRELERRRTAMIVERLNREYLIPLQKQNEALRKERDQRMKVQRQHEQAEKRRKRDEERAFLSSLGFSPSEIDQQMQREKQGEDFTEQNKERVFLKSLGLSPAEIEKASR